MLLELRHSLRRLLSSATFSFTTVLLLGLGIAAISIVFAFIDTILLQRLPINAASELVILSKANALEPPPGTEELFAYPNYKQFKADCRLTKDLFAFHTARRLVAMSAKDQSAAVEAQGQDVSGNYFSALGVSPFLGRLITPDDDLDKMGNQAIVLSFRFWNTYLGGETGIIGQKIFIDGHLFEVIGIAPSTFVGIEPGRAVDFWIPLLDVSFGRSLEKEPRMIVSIMGRLTPGATDASAAAELNGIFQRYLEGKEIPKETRQKLYGNIYLQPGASGFHQSRGKIQSLLSILMAVASANLLLICANIGGLVLLRASSRRREISIKHALGATRLSLLKQTVLESGILALAAVCVSLLLSYYGRSFLSRYIDSGAASNWHVDWSTFWVTIAASAASGILIAAAAIPQIREGRLITALKDEGATVVGGPAGYKTLLKYLVVGQIMISMALISTTGLFARTLHNLYDVDLGFDKNNLLFITLSFDRPMDAAARANEIIGIVDRIALLPGVTKASVFEFGGSMRGSSPIGAFIKVDGDSDFNTDNVPAFFTFVGPDFFQTSKITILDGKPFDRTDFGSVQPSPSAVDQGTSPADKFGVAIVDQTVAARYFSHTNPIGRIVRAIEDRPYRIVGVARSTKYMNLSEGKNMEVYIPITERWNSLPLTRLSLAIRSAVPPATLLPSIRELIRIADPSLRLRDTRTMNTIMAEVTSQEYMVTQACTYASIFAILLSCVGLYGVLSDYVARRGPEIGLRMALGAKPSNIFLSVFKHGMGLTAVGCITGIIVSLPIARLIAHRLYGVTPVDAPTMLFAASLTMVSSALACWLPSRRAIAIDPIVVIKGT